MFIRKLNTLFLLSFIIAVFTSCATGSKLVPNNAEEAFDAGLKQFAKREYTEALSFFDLIKLQYPGSKIVDKAQYYTAEINFARKEYILASFNYNRVRAMFPGSELAKISLYKAGYSQYLMSPDYHKDQDYTRKAIKTLQDYQFFYPEKDSLYNEAEKMIINCRNLLGEKEYQTAQLYDKLKSPRSALIYYESIIRNYDDTKYLEPAWFGKISILYILNRIEEAQSTELTYNMLFPNGAFVEQIEKLHTKN